MQCVEDTRPRQSPEFSFSIFCPDVPQLYDLCKPFSTCFRPVFRPNSLFCRRCWLTFAIVCTTGGNDAAPRPPQSTPTPNVQKKGENSDLSPFSHVFGLFFALPPFSGCRCWLSFAIVFSTDGKDAAPKPSEGTPTPNLQKKGEKPLVS